MRLAALLLVVGTAAGASETAIGVIRSYDGGVTSNRYLSDGGFDIGFPKKVAIQCDADSYICTDRDRASCTTTTGVLVQDSVLFPTSVDYSSNALAPTLSDGGFVVVPGGLISVLPVTVAATNCTVFNRTGPEASVPPGAVVNESNPINAGTVSFGPLPPQNGSGFGAGGARGLLAAYTSTNVAMWVNNNVSNAWPPDTANYVFRSDYNNTRLSAASEVILEIRGLGETVVLAGTPARGSIYPSSPYGEYQVSNGLLESGWSGVYAWKLHGLLGRPRCVWSVGFDTAATTFNAVGCAAPTSPTGTPSAVLGTGSRQYIQYAGAASANAVAGLNGGPFTQVRPYMRPNFGAFIRTDSAITNRRIWVGLAESTLATLAQAASGSSSIDFVAYSYDSAVSANWWLCSGDGTNYSCTDTGTVVAVSTEYGISLDWRIAGNVRFCLDVANAYAANTQPQCIDKATNLSTAAVGLGAYVANTTLNSSAQNMQIASVEVQ